MPTNENGRAMAARSLGRLPIICASVLPLTRVHHAHLCITSLISWVAPPSTQLQACKWAEIQERDACMYLMWSDLTSTFVKADFLCRMIGCYTLYKNSVFSSCPPTCNTPWALRNGFRVCKVLIYKGALYLVEARIRCVETKLLERFDR